MMRRVALPMVTKTMPAAGMVSATTATAARNYNFVMFKNPERRPQLTKEDRDKVVIDQSQWPEEFKDFDPENPYKNTPEFIEGMSTWTYWIWGLEAALIYQFYELDRKSVV